MVNRISALLVIFASLALSGSVFAAVSAQLSAQNIDELETVRLLIKITETRQSQPLDLSALESDFHIMNTNTVSQSRYLNGRGQTWVDYQITLQPKRTGTLKIPSIQVGQEQTPSLELNVRPLSKQTRQVIEEMVFFENEVSNNTIYVQSQLVLTRRLLYSQGVQLYSDLPGAPELANAVVLTLGETLSGTTQRNGKPYGVVQQQYAIFPETSGAFTVPGISITASVRLIENDRASRKGVRIGTEDVTINVLPVPAEYPADQPWLPAEKVTLYNVLSPDRGSYQVGDTLTHELLVHIEGNIGTISPPIPLVLDDNKFRLYPQAPVIEDDTSGEIVKGSRLQTHSIVPLQPGNLRLPTSELTWWDTANKTVRINRSQPLTLAVEGTAVVQSPAPEDTVDEASTSNDPGTPVEAKALDIAALLPYLYALLGLVAAVLVYLLRHRWSNLVKLKLPRKSHHGNDKFLQGAFASGDAHLLHEALGRYLSEHYQCRRPEAFRQFVLEVPEAASALAKLNRHLYATPQDNDDGHLGESVKILQNACRTLVVNRAPIQPDVLPQLYPHTT